jgi:manganese/zinc/iron transport system substrate-binding protein
MFVVVALVLACGRAPDPGPASSAAAPATGSVVKVIATTGMIADAAREVGGAHVQVTALMGPGVDPHLYKASAGDVARMTDADLVLYNGLHLEGAMAEVFERMQGRKRTRAVAEAIPVEKRLAVAGHAGTFDPHVWFDVSLWRHAVEATRDALCEAAPAHEAAFRSNAARYLAALDELHAHVRARADSLPAARRVLVTAHDAFSYFGRAYGFEVKGLQGISTATEAGTADVRELADFLVARQVPALFVESSVPRRTIEAVQAAVTARGSQVSIGGSLYSDALGDPTGAAGTYLGMVRANIDTLVTALAASAPAAGAPAP